ncbi:MAG: lysylphosphatidylglycerol synthase domain-containing protein [Gemmatimonadetes bacterium]|nr:lysylphosphatidylglycerol synthase domain-containing protein [Gemmatimonadota bacterium]
MSPTRRRVVFWAGAALGVFLVVLLLARYELSVVVQPLRQSRIHFLAAVLGLQLTIQVINAVTPVVLLGQAVDGAMSFWARTRVFLAGQPLALVAPGRLTDFGVIPLLKAHYKPGALASSIVLDRLITLFFLLLLTPLALRLAWPGSSTGATNMLVLVALVVVASTPFLFVNAHVREIVNKTVLRLWPSLLEGFGAHIDALLYTSWKRLLGNLCLTIVKTVLAGASISLLAANVGLPLGLLTAIWMSILIQIVTSVPIAPQGLGVAEGLLVLLFEVNEFPGALALSMGIVARTLFIPVMVAIYCGATLPLIAQRVANRAAPDR